MLTKKRSESKLSESESMREEQRKMEKENKQIGRMLIKSSHNLKIACN